MGVWIETLGFEIKIVMMSSHPVWVCGLKQKRWSFWWNPCGVTPCMGVWIETLLRLKLKKQILVTPCMGVWIETCIHRQVKLNIFVTPCMGVWIETTWAVMLSKPSDVTPCMGVWIETTLTRLPILSVFRHTLYGCVDWNIAIRAIVLAIYRHTLYGCVDWNHVRVIQEIHILVTPCMGVWIETSR